MAGDAILAAARPARRISESPPRWRALTSRAATGEPAPPSSVLDSSAVRHRPAPYPCGLASHGPGDAGGSRAAARRVAVHRALAGHQRPGRVLQWPPMISGETPLVAFVSSRQSTETSWARTATSEVLEQSDWITPWRFEQTPPSSARLSDSYLSKVRSSDLVIWLVDHHTSAPVTEEIAVALETHRPLLVFRISPPPSEAATESLLERVGTKWAYVVDSIDLKMQLRLALQDELIRRWRAAGRSTITPILDLLNAHSRSRCIDRWLAAGVPQALAVALTEDPAVGMLHVPVFSPGRFAILRAEIGAGKSLLAERLFQDALRCARTSIDEKPPVFLEARNIEGSLDSCLVLHPAVPDPRIHETGYRVGAWRWPRGRFLYGAKSPFFSWTRSPASTPYCETGDSSGERAL